jgi:hypothetical protein
MSARREESPPAVREPGKRGRRQKIAIHAPGHGRERLVRRVVYSRFLNVALFFGILGALVWAVVRYWPG